ncbi:hypothetical protein A8938_3297 [Algoriphagus zhangzhouensis]|nr:hypothetical protein A8938_3297 [Algoriphagus zhangzhouensis]
MSGAFFVLIGIRKNSYEKDTTGRGRFDLF